MHYAVEGGIAHLSLQARLFISALTPFVYQLRRFFNIEFGYKIVSMGDSSLSAPQMKYCVNCGFVRFYDIFSKNFITLTLKRDKPIGCPVCFL